MRGAQQICEAIVWEPSPDGPKSHFCLSQARWMVDLDWLKIFFCTSCHAVAELEFAANGTPRKTYYSESGYRPHAGHEAACERHASAFATLYDRKDKAASAVSSPPRCTTQRSFADERADFWRSFVSQA